MRLFLSIYGISVEVFAVNLETARALELLGRDFDYFRVESSADKPQITLEIPYADFDAQSESTGPRVFKTKMCAVYGWGSRRFCDYGKGVWVKSIESSSARCFTVYGKDMDLIYEAAYLALLSSIGEALDLRGFHRLHAVGFEFNGQAVVMAADSGLGKSATAALLMQNGRAKVFSDEMPLISEGKIYPFPIRMALHRHVAQSLGIDLATARDFKRKIYPTKALIEIEPQAVASVLPLSRFYFGVLGDSPTARSMSLSEKLRLIVTIVMGLGLPQMAEHMLRANNLLSLARIALSRLKTAIEILGGSKKKIDAQTIVLSTHPKANLQELTQALGATNRTSAEAKL